MTESTLRHTLDTWAISWPILEVMVYGKSSIDMERLTVSSMAEATEFVRSYGYDPDLPEHQRYLHGLIVEAWQFIEHSLMPTEWKRGIVPPPAVLYCKDPRELLLFASDTSPMIEHALRQAWSCAILRVLHTISHIEGVQRLADLEAARTQVLDRFAKFVTKGPDGGLVLGDGRVNVPLVHLDWKVQKSRESMILKLLHKRANVAETIYDQLGVRIVTNTLADAVLAVDIIQRNYMVTFPNCNPSRARNSMFDFESFKQQHSALYAKLVAGTISAEDFMAQVENIKAPVQEDEKSNPHSSLNYRALQFTCRQLIRWPNPILSWMPRLKDAMSSYAATEVAIPQINKVLKSLTVAIEGWHGVAENMQLSAFFPFEVQIMDQESYRVNKFGDASHDKYKRLQSRTARRRVLSRVLELTGA